MVRQIRNAQTKIAADRALRTARARGRWARGEQIRYARYYGTFPTGFSNGKVVGGSQDPRGFFIGKGNNQVTGLSETQALTGKKQIADKPLTDLEKFSIGFEKKQGRKPVTSRRGKNSDRYQFVDKGNIKTTSRLKDIPASATGVVDQKTGKTISKLERQNIERVGSTIFTKTGKSFEVRGKSKGEKIFDVKKQANKIINNKIKNNKRVTAKDVIQAATGSRVISKSNLSNVQKKAADITAAIYNNNNKDKFKILRNTVDSLYSDVLKKTVPIVVKKGRELSYQLGQPKKNYVLTRKEKVIKFFKEQGKNIIINNPFVLIAKPNLDLILNRKKIIKDTKTKLTTLKTSLSTKEGQKQIARTALSPLVGVYKSLEGTVKQGALINAIIAYNAFEKVRPPKTKAEKKIYNQVYLKLSKSAIKTAKEYKGNQDIKNALILEAFLLSNYALFGLGRLGATAIKVSQASGSVKAFYAGKIMKIAAKTGLRSLDSFGKLAVGASVYETTKNPTPENIGNLIQFALVNGAGKYIRFRLANKRPSRVTKPKDKTVVIDLKYNPKTDTYQYNKGGTLRDLPKKLNSKISKVLGNIVKLSKSALKSFLNPSKPKTKSEQKLLEWKEVKLLRSELYSPKNIVKPFYENPKKAFVIAKGFSGLKEYNRYVKLFKLSLSGDKSVLPQLKKIETRVASRRIRKNIPKVFKKFNKVEFKGKVIKFPEDIKIRAPTRKGPLSEAAKNKLNKLGFKTLKEYKNYKKLEIKVKKGDPKAFDKLVVMDRKRIAFKNKMKGRRSLKTKSKKPKKRDLKKLSIQRFKESQIKKTKQPKAVRKTAIKYGKYKGKYLFLGNVYNSRKLWLKAIKKYASKNRLSFDDVIKLLLRSRFNKGEKIINKVKKSDNKKDLTKAVKPSKKPKGRIIIDIQSGDKRIKVDSSGNAFIYRILNIEKTTSKGQKILQKQEVLVETKKVNLNKKKKPSTVATTKTKKKTKTKRLLLVKRDQKTKSKSKQVASRKRKSKLSSNSKQKLSSKQKQKQSRIIKSQIKSFATYGLFNLQKVNNVLKLPNAVINAIKSDQKRIIKQLPDRKQTPEEIQKTKQRLIRVIKKRLPKKTKKTQEKQKKKLKKRKELLEDELLKFKLPKKDQKRKKIKPKKKKKVKKKRKFTLTLGGKRKKAVKGRIKKRFTGLEERRRRLKSKKRTKRRKK